MRPLAKSTSVARLPLAALALLVSLAGARAADEPGAIYVMKVDGTQVRKLAQADGFSDHASPRWSRDGKRVAFDALPVGGGDRKCFIVKFDGTDLQQVGAQAMPDWSPDDKQLTFQQYPATGGRAHVFVQNLDGQGLVDIAQGASPRWSPDGGKLAMSDGKQLSTIDLVTSEEVPLFEEPFFELFRGFAWSPDGKRLAVAVRTADGAKRQLMIVSADGAGKGVTLRMKSNLGGHVSFSPDGKQLVFSTDNSIHILDVDGKSPPRRVPSQRGKNRNPDWSPDGQWIVFTSDRDQK
jgi:TolB protein